MPLVAGAVFGLLMVLAGGLLLRFHRESAAFWSRAGVRTPAKRIAYFYRYKSGPILLVVAGMALLVLAVLGAFGLGPAPYRH